MSVKTLRDVAENYFHTLNPLAERIGSDIEAIKDAYEDLWYSLSNKEKDQIINESVIYPEAILKYALTSSTYESGDWNQPKLTGSKYIVDEHTGLSWRDEHSAPFSWKTPSQIDLRIFTSKTDSPYKPNDSAFINNQITLNKALYHENILECTPIKNGTFFNDGNKDDVWARKLITEKNGVKKCIDTPDSPNVVLGGTCSKISGLCSKLKFLPGKSCSYEVKTVVSYSSNANNDSNLLDKLKASAVLKIQNTIKLVGGKNYVSAEKKSVNDVSETENLVQPKTNVTITKLTKPSPKVAKPKSPPPPPPILKPKQDETDGNETGKTIMVKKDEKSITTPSDSEKAALLEDNSIRSFPSGGDSFDKDYSKVIHELSEEFNSISTEYTPLSGPSSDNIPKSGFDFLDNW